MRFISPYTKYKLMAIHEQVETLATGRSRSLAPGFTAEWRPHDATDAEREQARSTFTFRGTVTDEGGRQIDPIDEQHRISTFDTGEINDPVLREKVEQALLSNSAFGHDYVLADQPLRLDAPVPNWVKLTTAQGRRTVEMCAEKAVEMVQELGVDLDAAVAFERQEERKESEAIIAALGSLSPAEPDVELVSA